MPSKSLRLSKKERAFAKEYAKTGNGVQSALKTYDTVSYGTASTIADANLGKPRVQDFIKSIADRIPDELLYETHINGLKAMRHELFEDIPDHAVRHKYLDTAYKLKNLYPKEGGGTAIQININTDQQEFR